MLADTAGTRRKQVHWLDASSMSCSRSCGSSTGPASTWPRTHPAGERLRDALTSVSRPWNGPWATGWASPGSVTCWPSTRRCALRALPVRADPGRSPRTREVTAAIAAALAAQDVTVPAEAATGRVISELATELDRVAICRDALAAEIEEAFLSCPSGELLASMPGIGPRTGAASSPKSATAPPSHGGPASGCRGP